MREFLSGTVLVPLASERDAESTCRALRRHLSGGGVTVRAVHVIEKAGGAPDKASVAQREEVADRIFAIVSELQDEPGVTVETEIRYGTDVAESVFEAAAAVDASAIVFTPRGGSRWIRLLTGDVALDLITETDRPVVVLPDLADEERGGDGDETTDAAPDGGDYS